MALIRVLDDVNSLLRLSYKKLGGGLGQDNPRRQREHTDAQTGAGQLKGRTDLLNRRPDLGERERKATRKFRPNGIDLDRRRGATVEADTQQPLELSRGPLQTRFRNGELGSGGTETPGAPDADKRPDLRLFQFQGERFGLVAPLPGGVDDVADRVDDLIKEALSFGCGAAAPRP